MIDQRFSGKTVLIIGATGGLGVAFARAFAKEGAQVLLTARNPEALDALAREIDAGAVLSVDLAELESIQALRESVAPFAPLAAVINATGYDVRKPLASHSEAEIDRSLDVNLRGAMLLTQAFLPAMQPTGIIAHMGGFADGRLSFPYYSADAASRAGLRAFIDAVNRESDGPRALYFSPAPANTDAERPYHALWK